MSVFAIADLHLSLTTNKPMDVFGGGWEGYVEKLETNWKNTVSPEDTVIIPGDVSWAISLSEAEKDFEFINSLPGKKIIGKGNHDYWWTSLKKMNAFLKAHSFDTIRFLHNNAFACDNLIVCGSRGWMIDGSDSFDRKIQEREAIRLRLSLDAAKKLRIPDKKPTVFLHYPPVYRGAVCEPIVEALKDYGVEQVYYGHLHGVSKESLTYLHDEIKLTIISADFLKFKPLLIE